MKLKKKHIKQFWTYVAKWAVLVGVADWRLVKQEEEKHPDDECVCADVRSDPVNHVAVITLYRQWPDTADIDDPDVLSEFALHEVLHVVMADLMARAQGRHSTEEELNRAEHDVIRSVLAMVFKHGLLTEEL